MSLLEFYENEIGTTVRMNQCIRFKMDTNCETVNREIMIEGKYKIGYLN